MNKMPLKCKIAIFSVSAGAGHIRAAQALQASAKHWYPDVETVHIDIMDLVPAVFRKVYVDSYLALVEKHPAIWGYIYNKTDREHFDSTFNRLRRVIERLATRRLKHVLEEIKPDHVICTHFLPAQLMSRKAGSGKYLGSVWIQVTDFDLHSLWVQENIRGYFVACDEVAWRLVNRGIAANQIHETGIPIMPAFGGSFDRNSCASEFGLDPTRPIVLLMSGSTGIGPCEILAEYVLDLEEDFQLIVLAGRNRKLLTSMETLAKRYPGRLFPMGFTNVIERLMAIADLAITKPGGLTTSECLAMGLPMILVSPIPGQEERNAEYLLENNVAMKAGDPIGLAWRVKLLLKGQERLAAMRDHALEIGQKDAARKVLDIVLSQNNGAIE